MKTPSLASRSLLFLFLGASSYASAATLSLPLTDDSWINGGNPSANFGAATSMFVHDFGPKHGLVQFDAASVASQTINSATLRLFLRRIRSPGDISIHAITSPWNEGSVSWDTQPSFQLLPIGFVGLDVTDAGSIVSIDVTSIVRQWAEGTLPDAGFMIVDNTGIRSFFDSKEMSGGTPASLEVLTQDGPTPNDGTLPMIVDLSTLPVVIDEPGHYVLDRNWDVDDTAGFDGTVIDIQAGHVFFDMRGFEIRSSHIAGFGILISGDEVTLVNGRIDTAAGDDQLPVFSTGVRTIVDNLTVLSDDLTGVNLFGMRSVVKNSSLDAGALIVGNQGTIQSCDLSCDTNCLVVRAHNVSVMSNRVTNSIDTAIRIQGHNAILARNIVDIFDSTEIGLFLEGNNALVLENVLRRGDLSATGIVVDGTANILKDNIALPDPSGEKWNVGISFLQDGNFYGDNQMAADVPFELNGTVQTDWGGNVGF